MTLTQVRRRTHEILEVAQPGDIASRAFDFFILSLIALNVAALMVESVEGIHSRFPEGFRAFEVFSVVVFTLEYVLRVWSCTLAERFSHPVWGRVRFVLTPMALVDLSAVAPFYLPFLGVDLRFMRAVRLVRLFRVLKVARYSTAIRLIGRVVRAKREELAVTLFVLSLLLVLASSLIYFCEHDVQPAAFPSIPAAMWWSVSTLTTVGYGDIYPVTAPGKIVASLVAILGIGMFALPTGILGAGFLEEVQTRKGKRRTCPHCGKPLDA